MTSNAARNNRLRSLFNAIVHGQREVGTNGPLFIEAIAAQPDPLVCITTIISQPKGLPSISTAMSTLKSLPHLNGIASDFLLYLRHKDVKNTNNGQFLAAVIKAVVEPDGFWLAFLNAFRLGELQEKGQFAFAFLLLQLLQLESDPDIHVSYLPIAQDPDILKRLSNQTSEDGRQLGAQIEKITIRGTTAPIPVRTGPGGRHDNDFVDFREISILPTSDEILCQEPSFLRPSDALDDPQTAHIRPELFLDSQFRLLREDMLYEMREELQGILNTDSGKKKGGRRGLVIEGLTITNAYCGPDGRRTQWGLCFKPSKDFPQLKDIKEPKKRVASLTKDDRGKKILRHQSLTCLLADNKIVAFPVIHRDEDLLAKNPPIIVLQFTGKRAITKTLLTAKTANDLKLIFIDTAIFSYEPVLKALQEMTDIPLSQELLYWDATRNVDRPLSSPRSELASLIWRLKSNPQQDLRPLLNLTKSIRLDKAQGASMIAGLTQPVSLIQGPPGTGKSFIGALLAKFIHDYTSDIILVVCYTNHALDQFLLDLTDIGIPTDNIVRVGGKPNPEMEAMSLQKHKLSHRFTPTEHSAIQATKADAEVCATSFEATFERYQTSSAHLSDSTLMDHIEFEDPDYFYAFRVPANEVGVFMAGRGGKAVDEYYLLQQWTQGKDAGAFKSYPDITGNQTKVKIWRMSRGERQARINKWRGDILRYVVNEVCNMAEAYGRTQTELSRKYAQKDVAVLRSKRIIGCTTTGAAKYKEIIQKASPDVLLVEEAGEILESHVITALSANTRQIILIGDHKQLRPKVNNYQLTFEKGEGYNLNVSLFERLVLKGYPHQVLEEQHRMRPEISALIRHLTYPDLTDSPRTQGRPNLLGVQDNIAFINHSRPEDENKQLADKKDMGAKSSKQNTFEVQMVVEIVRYLLLQGYKSEDLVILTPYLGQLYLLQAALRKAPDTDAEFNDLDFQDLVRAGIMPNRAQPDKERKKIRLATVDNYQGEESNIVVASLCRSNPGNDIGFMFSPERLNVLLSRAKNSLIVIGNLNTFTNARKGKELWTNLVGKLKAGNHIYDGFPAVCGRHPGSKSLVKTPQDFALQCPDGRCNQPCGRKLSCGLHNCEFRCHADDLHLQVKCQEMVQDTCRWGHEQPSRSCSQPVPIYCQAMVQDACVSGHKQPPRKCSQPVPISCQTMVQDTCASGHKQPPRKCSERVSRSCQICAYEAALAEAERRRQEELERKRQRQRMEYDTRMRHVEFAIFAEQAKIRKQKIAEQREEARRQKQAELDAARANSFYGRSLSYIQSFFTPQSPGSQPPQNSRRSASPSGYYDITLQDNTKPTTSPFPPPRPQTPPGNPATRNHSSPEAEWQRQKNVEGAVSSVIDSIMAKPGLEEVKRQILHIKDKADIIKRGRVSLPDQRFNLMFFGSAGTGTVAVARLYAEFLALNQIVSGPAFFQTSGTLLLNGGVPEIEKMVKDVLKAGGGTIFIDEAYKLCASGPNQAGAQQGDQVLNFISTEVEGRKGRLVIILGGYAKQMEGFLTRNHTLQQLFPYTLEFADSADEDPFFARELQNHFRLAERKQQATASGQFQ